MYSEVKAVKSLPMWQISAKLFLLGKSVALCVWPGVKDCLCFPKKRAGEELFLKRVEWIEK